jgi:hypothetical protein
LRAPSLTRENGRACCCHATRSVCVCASPCVCLCVSYFISLIAFSICLCACIMCGDRARPAAVCGAVDAERMGERPAHVDRARSPRREQQHRHLPGARLPSRSMHRTLTAVWALVPVVHVLSMYDCVLLLCFSLSFCASLFVCVSLPWMGRRRSLPTRSKA